MHKLDQLKVTPRYYAAVQIVLATWSHYASRVTYLRRR